MKNLENIKEVLDFIEANPSCWGQKDWHCGSKHCFAGHAQIRLTGKEDVSTVRRDARIFFGFTKREADYYFAASRTLDELRTALLDFYGNDGYGIDGYNREGYGMDGYDRYGYDRKGYNRDGYVRYGYDIEGYGRDGYDRMGYNLNGYDRRGYNRFGYDRYGYDRGGYNREGYDRDGYDEDGLDINNKPKNY
jgi:hypothetical protein